MQELLHTKRLLPFPLLSMLWAILLSFSFDWSNNPCLYYALLISGTFMVCAAIIDFYTLKLPHILTLPAAMIAIYGNATWGYGWKFAIAGAIGGYLILKSLQLFARWKYAKNCIGSGDCVFMLSIGSWVGLEGAYCAIVIAYIIVLFMVRMMKKGNKWIPFGPFLAVGWVCVLTYNIAIAFFLSSP